MTGVERKAVKEMAPIKNGWPVGKIVLVIVVLHLLVIGGILIYEDVWKCWGDRVKSKPTLNVPNQGALEDAPKGTTLVPPEVIPVPAPEPRKVIQYKAPAAASEEDLPPELRPVKKVEPVVAPPPVPAPIVVPADEAEIAERFKLRKELENRTAEVINLQQRMAELEGHQAASLATPKVEDPRKPGEIRQGDAAIKQPGENYREGCAEMLVTAAPMVVEKKEIVEVVTSKGGNIQGSFNDNRKVDNRKTTISILPITISGNRLDAANGNRLDAFNGNSAFCGGAGVGVGVGFRVGVDGCHHRRPWGHCCPRSVPMPRMSLPVIPMPPQFIEDCVLVPVDEMQIVNGSRGRSYKFYDRESWHLVVCGRFPPPIVIGPDGRQSYKFDRPRW
jgi:hypothetical protein